MRELLNRKGLMILGAILAVFAIGLVGFYLFSAEQGDGLEVAMEDAGVEEAEPVYSGPLDYGGNYLATLAMGIIGFLVTLLAVYLLVRLLKKNEA